MRKLPFPLILLVLAGCSTTGDSEPPIRGWRTCPDAAAPVDRPCICGDAAGERAVTDAPQVGSLTGTFAVQAHIHVRLFIDLYSHMYFLMEMEQEGRQLRLATTNCEIELPSYEGVAKMTILPAVMELLRDRPFVSEGEFLSSDQLPLAFHPDSQVFHLGVDFEGRDPFTDPLPTVNDLSHQLDEDEDGNPGVTVDVEAATCQEPQQLYVALRTVVRMKAQQVDSWDALEGSLEATLDQEVLGYSDPCLELATSMRPEVQDDCTFRALRVDGANGTRMLDADGDGDVSCDEVDPHVESLFPEE